MDNITIIVEDFTQDVIVEVLAGGIKGDKGDNAIQSDAFYLGFYDTDLSLKTAYPVALDGNYATVGTTDTIWIWDTDTLDWVDTGNPEGLLPINSVGLAELKPEVKDNILWKDNIIAYSPTANYHPATKEYVDESKSVTNSQEVNSENPIIIPTYDGDNSVTHPSVLYIPDSWNSYMYWMAFTPYPASPRENPSIVCSNDGVTWVVPTGLTNPIKTNADAISLGLTYWSDTDIVMMPDNLTMVLFFRGVKGSSPYKEEIYRMKSTDGVNWTDFTLVYTTNSDGKCVSPSFLYEDNGDLKMYFCNYTLTIGNTLNYVVSSNDGDTWGAVQSCTYPNYRSKLWHLDIIKTEGEYHLLYTSRLLAQEPGIVFPAELYHLKSADGITWYWGYGIIEKSNEDFNVNGFYKSSFISRIGDTRTFDLFLSCIGPGANPLYDSEWYLSVRKNVDLNKKIISNDITSSFILTDKMQEQTLKIDTGVSNSLVITTDLSLRNDFVCGGILLGGGDITISSGVGTTLIQADSTNLLNTEYSTFFIIRDKDSFILRVNNI